MKLGYLLTLAAALAASSTQAAVLTNVIITPEPDPFLFDWELKTSKGDASLIGTLSGSTLVADTWTIGISHNWYSVEEGLAFTPSYAAIATPFAPFADNDRLTVTLSEPFFLGVELGDRESEPEDYRIGWVELEYDGSSLTAIRSATEDSGSGLFVGSLTVVPEPSTVSFAMLGLIGLIARRRRTARH